MLWYFTEFAFDSYNLTICTVFDSIRQLQRVTDTVVDCRGARLPQPISVSVRLPQQMIQMQRLPVGSSVRQLQRPRRSRATAITATTAVLDCGSIRLQQHSTAMAFDSRSFYQLQCSTTPGFDRWSFRQLLRGRQHSTAAAFNSSSTQQPQH